MNKLDGPFEVLVVEESPDEFDALRRKPVSPAELVAALHGAATARFHGFDVEDRPLVVGLPDLPHEIVRARTTVRLLRSQIGSSVVLLFEGGDVRRPIVVGVIQDRGVAQDSAGAPQQLVSVQADDDRVVVSAEREIVLRCGEASITLTRAGRVLIKGTYVLSRSSGHNKIKGAAVDIN
jgi:hypothetical protein